MGLTPFTIFLSYMNWCTKVYVDYFEKVSKQPEKKPNVHAQAYEILGIEPTDDKTKIKNAYRKLARTYHPDVYEGDENVFLKIKDAYEILMVK